MKIVFGSETLDNYLHNWTISSPLREYGAIADRYIQSSKIASGKVLASLARGQNLGFVDWVVIKTDVNQER